MSCQLNLTRSCWLFWRQEKVRRSGIYIIRSSFQKDCVLRVIHPLSVSFTIARTQTSFSQVLGTVVCWKVSDKNMLDIRGASRTKLRIFGTRKLHLRVSDARTLVTFSVMYKVVVNFLSDTMYIDRIQSPCTQTKRKWSHTASRWYKSSWYKRLGVQLSRISLIYDNRMQK